MSVTLLLDSGFATPVAGAVSMFLLPLLCICGAQNVPVSFAFLFMISTKQGDTIPVIYDTEYQVYYKNINTLQL